MMAMKKTINELIFTNIYKEMKDYIVKDEVEEFNLFIQLIKEKGFFFNPKSYLILNRRGEMQRQRLQRCNMRKNFKRDTNKKCFFEILCSINSDL